MAYFVTGEVLGPTQWLGVLLVLVGVFLLNQVPCEVPELDPAPCHQSVNCGNASIRC
ncbi:MAG: hypothetical protein CM15mP74_22670 [Halieaceae bacterium]|nr:MAG: hypothetical protein CM15mP74_22670 [Halieaceae bacterium]